MAKVEYRKLEPNERKRLERELFSALLHPKKQKDSVSLFFNLLTPSERIMLNRRIQVAKYLIAGKSYIEIRADLGVGFELIVKVDRWLDGEIEAYRKIIPPLIEAEKTKQKNVRRGSKKPLGTRASFEGMRRRYPDKFGLINMLLDD